MHYSRAYTAAPIGCEAHPCPFVRPIRKKARFRVHSTGKAHHKPWPARGFSEAQHLLPLFRHYRPQTSPSGKIEKPSGGHRSGNAARGGPVKMLFTEKPTSRRAVLRPPPSVSGGNTRIHSRCTASSRKPSFSAGGWFSPRAGGLPPPLPPPPLHGLSSGICRPSPEIPPPPQKLYKERLIRPPSWAGSI